MLHGCDVSKWQGTINWSKLSKDVDFAIIRSSYGTGQTDVEFERNKTEARKYNVPHGFYHYAYPQLNTPEAEADWFRQVIGELQTGEFLCLDFEENYHDPVGWSLRFLDRLSGLLGGYKPLIYINKSLMNSHKWVRVINKGYGLWLAYWNYDPDNNDFETPWPVVAFRQWSNRESFDGISGRVDANVFFGDKEALTAYGVVVEDTSDLHDTVIDWDDAEGNRHTVGWYVYEWWVEKSQNMNTDTTDYKSMYEDLQIEFRDYQKETEAGFEAFGEQIKTLKGQAENLQKMLEVCEEGETATDDDTETPEDQEETDSIKQRVTVIRDWVIGLFNWILMKGDDDNANS